MAAPRGHEPMPRDQGYLRNARELFNRQKFKEARVAFEKVMTHCACAKPLRAIAAKMSLPAEAILTPKCVCRSFSVKNLTSSSQTDFYAIAKQTCRCGSAIKQCDSYTHIKGLDGAAAACEALKDFEAAYEFSVLMIIIAPADPLGYLRMAKLMRIQRAPLHECCIVYKQGIKAVSNFGDKTSSSLWSLKKLVMQHTRVDFVMILPAELNAKILSHLTMPDLCCTMRVSKAWRRQALNKTLWEDLRFHKSFGTVTHKVFETILLRRAQSGTKSIVIGNAQRFGLDLRKLHLIFFGAPKLQKLKIAATCKNSLLHGEPGIALPAQMPELTKLCFDHVFVAPSSFRQLTAILKYVAPTLVELSLRFDSALQFPWTSFPEMHKLQTLQLWDRKLEVLMGRFQPRLSRVMTPAQIPAVIPDLESILPLDPPGSHLFSCPSVELSYRTPNLRRLHLYGEAFSTAQSLPPDDSPYVDNWQKLEDLAIAGPTSFVFYFDFRLTKNLKRLDLNDAAILDTQLPNADNEDEILAAYQRFENLEHFRATTVIPGRALQNLLAPSVANGKLRGLELTYMTSIADVDQIIGLSTLDFLHKEQIEVLGLSNFHYPFPDWESPDHKSKMTFLEWIATFPNLHTVIMYPFPIPGINHGIEGLIHMGIKAIITDALVGVEYDRIMALGKVKGVNVIYKARSDEARTWRSIESQW